jgi:hypothetical protein
LTGKKIESQMPKYRKRMTGNYAEKIPMENVDEGNITHSNKIVTTQPIFTDQVMKKEHYSLEGFHTPFRLITIFFPKMFNIKKKNITNHETLHYERC